MVKNYFNEVRLILIVVESHINRKKPYLKNFFQTAIAFHFMDRK